MKSWGQPIVNKTLRPHILGQANIPKPLHGINPRTIMGDNAWRAYRQQVVQNHPYCTTCGKESLNLDVHEDYEINYKTRVSKIKDYVPLCKECHMFIHSGLLAKLLADKQISRDRVFHIVERGINACRENDVCVFIVGYQLSKQLKIDVQGVKYWSPPPTSWNNWTLEYNNKSYKGLTQKQWMNLYC